MGPPDCRKMGRDDREQFPWNPTLYFFAGAMMLAGFPSTEGPVLSGRRRRVIYRMFRPPKKGSGKGITLPSSGTTVMVVEAGPGF